MIKSVINLLSSALSTVSWSPWHRWPCPCHRPETSWRRLTLTVWVFTSGLNQSTLTVFICLTFSQSDCPVFTFWPFNNQINFDIFLMFVIITDQLTSCSSQSQCSSPSSGPIRACAGLWGSAPSRLTTNQLRRRCRGSHQTNRNRKWHQRRRTMRISQLISWGRSLWRCHCCRSLVGKVCFTWTT